MNERDQYLVPAGIVTIEWTRTNPSRKAVGTVETVEVFRDKRCHGALCIKHGDSVAPLMIVKRFATIH